MDEEKRSAAQVDVRHLPVQGPGWYVGATCGRKKRPAVLELESAVRALSGRGHRCPGTCTCWQRAGLGQPKPFIFKRAPEALGCVTWHSSIPVASWP